MYPVMVIGPVPHVGELLPAALDAWVHQRGVVVVEVAVLDVGPGAGRREPRKRLIRYGVDRQMVDEVVGPADLQTDPPRGNPACIDGHILNGAGVPRKYLRELVGEVREPAPSDGRAGPRVDGPEGSALPVDDRLARSSGEDD